jgi:hypothetical protein
MKKRPHSTIVILLLIRGVVELAKIIMVRPQQSRDAQEHALKHKPTIFMMMMMMMFGSQGK